MASAQSRTLASVVREAIALYVRTGGASKKRPLRFIASGRSGKRTTADRHETLLFRQLTPHGSGSAKPRAKR